MFKDGYSFESQFAVSILFSNFFPLSLGPSIIDVDSFSQFLTPPGTPYQFYVIDFPFTIIHPPPSPSESTSIMDGPLAKNPSPYIHVSYKVFNDFYHHVSFFTGVMDPSV